jgi:quercetin dioxygenase-like cupin family protein
MARNLRLAFVLFLFVCTVLVAGCGGDDEGPPSPADGVTQVERQLLDEATTDRAPGQTVQLTRVIIPAGQEIAAHTHPGPQLAVIAGGTLTYTVIQGKVQVTRAAGTPAAKSETVSSGQSVDLQPGDTVAETPDMIHTGRNAGDGPVVIYLSSLFPAGAPASSPAQ